ncbi:MAG: PaaI family thioesterase [Litorimonas sp.]
MKSKADIINESNKQGPAFLRMLGGAVVDFDAKKSTCTFQFDISKDFCHSIDIVQGGFVTAMLDAAMSHALFLSDPEIAGVSSLEIKTMYLEPTRAGKLRVEGWAVKKGYKTAFLEGRIYNTDGLLTATATTVSKILRRSKETV